MATKNYEIMMVFSVKDGEEAAKALQERFQGLILCRTDVPDGT